MHPSVAYVKSSLLKTKLNDRSQLIKRLCECLIEAIWLLPKIAQSRPLSPRAGHKCSMPITLCVCVCLRSSNTCYSLRFWRFYNLFKINTSQRF